MALRCVSDTFQRAGGNDSAAFVTAAGAHVNDIVGIADYIQIVLNHDHCRTVFDKFAENFEQSPDIQRMQSDGRLIENENGGPTVFCPFRSTASDAGLLRRKDSESPRRESDNQDRDSEEP